MALTCVLRALQWSEIRIGVSDCRNFVGIAAARGKFLKLHHAQERSTRALEFVFAAGVRESRHVMRPLSAECQCEVAVLGV